MSHDSNIRQNLKDQGKDLRTRQARSLRRIMNDASNQVVREESLSELSRNLLSRYVSRSARDLSLKKDDERLARNTYNVAADKASIAHDPYTKNSWRDMRDRAGKKINKASRKASNRQIGIGRAASRLGEENHDLDISEMSRNKLIDYKNKASRRVNQYFIGDKEARKRVKGIKMANKKILAANEEYLRELSKKFLKNYMKESYSDIKKMYEEEVEDMLEMMLEIFKDITERSEDGESIYVDWKNIADLGRPMRDAMVSAIPVAGDVKERQKSTIETSAVSEGLNRKLSNMGKSHIAIAAYDRLKKDGRAIGLLKDMERETDPDKKAALVAKLRKIRA